MYTNFRIQNFRGFKDFELKDIKRVNLIAGKNNVGKTSLLEAFFLHSGRYVIENVLRIQFLRGNNQSITHYGDDTPWKLLFHNLDANKTVIADGNYRGKSHKVQLRELSNPQQIETFTTYAMENIKNLDTVGLSLSDPKLRVLELTYISDNEEQKYHLIQTREGIKLQNPPPVNIEAFFMPVTGRIPPSEIAEYYGELAKQRRQHVLLNSLKHIEPRLKSLQVIPIQGIPMLYGDIGLPEDIPLSSMGEGMNRFANFILGMSKVEKGGVLLIDEIENGIHYSTQIDVWKTIDELSKAFSIQVFATTHSREMVMAAHEAFKDAESYDFKYYRLDRNVKTHEIEAVAYSERIMEAVEEMDAEVRG
jgi:AAA15 family ATPase/GTPase